LLRGRNGFNSRLIAPEQARVIVLPASVQVCVPLSLALRRTKVPLYLAWYSRAPPFHEPCRSMFWPLSVPVPCSAPDSTAASRSRTTWLYFAAPPAIVTAMASRILPLVNGILSHTSVPR
jgi:hypothetical protein